MLFGGFGDREKDGESGLTAIKDELVSLKEDGKAGTARNESTIRWLVQQEFRFDHRGLHDSVHECCGQCDLS